MTPNQFNKVVYRQLTKEEHKRLDEVLFYTTIKQMFDSRAISTLPIGTTVPKLLAALLGVNGGVIDHAYNTLTLMNNIPSTSELVLLLKERNVSPPKSMFTPVTYYKALKKWIMDGSEVLERRLSDIQWWEIRKFNQKFEQGLLGKRGSVAHLHLG